MRIVSHHTSQPATTTDYFWWLMCRHWEVTVGSSSNSSLTSSYTVTTWKLTTHRDVGWAVPMFECKLVAEGSPIWRVSHQYGTECKYNLPHKGLQWLAGIIILKNMGKNVSSWTQLYFIQVPLEKDTDRSLLYPTWLCWFLCSLIIMLRIWIVGDVQGASVFVLVTF